MELIFELCAELFLDIFGEYFLNLYTCFIPKKKLSDKSYRIIRRFSQFISVIFIFLLLIGIGILFGNDNGRTLGWIFVLVSVAYVVLGLVLRYVASIRRK